MIHTPLTGRWGASNPVTDGPDPSALVGRRFALPSDRKLDLFGKLLTARGAVLERYPLWSYLPVHSDERARAWVECVIDGAVQDVVWNSAEGVRSATEIAAGFGCDWALVRAMQRCRHFAANRVTCVALHRLGVRQIHLPESESSFGRILMEHHVCRRRVAVQLQHGAQGGEIVDLLLKMRCELHQARLHCLPAPRETALVRRLLSRLVRSELDGLVVGDLSEMARLFAVAGARQMKDALREALGRTRVIAMGPRVADELRQVNIEPALAARRTFHLLPLVSEVERVVGPRRRSCAS